MARSYALLSQGTEATCDVLVSGKCVQALLDTGACISILRLKDFKALNQKNRRLEAADMKIIQADGREIRITGAISLPISVGGVSTMQKFYVAPTICRAMILGRDWLESNKAQISFNPTFLKLGGKEIPLGAPMNEEVVVLPTKDIVLPPRTAIACNGRWSPAENLRQGIYQVTPTDKGYFEKGGLSFGI